MVQNMATLLLVHINLLDKKLKRTLQLLILVTFEYFCCRMSAISHEIFHPKVCVKQMVNSFLTIPGMSIRISIVSKDSYILDYEL